MAVFTAICYILGCICFLCATKRLEVMCPECLDLVALGLFFCALPTAVDRVIGFI